MAIKPEKFTIHKKDDKYYIINANGEAELYKRGNVWKIRDLKPASEITEPRANALKRAMVDWFIYSNKYQLPE